LAIVAQSTELAAADGSKKMLPPARSGPAVDWARLGPKLEAFGIPLLALGLSLILFGAFIIVAGHNPFDVYSEMYRGAFGTWFSFQNTLQRASPLMLTALCTALPARCGLIVIGGEGAFVIGGLAAAAAGVALNGAPTVIVLSGMFIAGAIFGGLWVGAAGLLRVQRGVNETISSLLLTYIGIALLNHFVEGPLRDPESLNKPSTLHIGEANMVGPIPGLDVHFGLVVGVLSSFANIDEMVDLTNIGTLFAFILVCIGIPILRFRDPHRPRPFRVPFGPLILPIFGAVSCLGLIYYLPPASWWRFVGWLVLGLVVYSGYGFSHSAIGRQMGRPHRTPLLLKVVSAALLALVIGLFMIPHNATPRKLYSLVTDPTAEGHGRAKLGLILAGAGLLVAIITWLVYRARFRPISRC